MFQELIVDLRRPPDARWHLTPSQQEQARELLGIYKADLGLRPDMEWATAMASGQRAVVTGLTLPLLAHYGYRR